MQKRRMNTTLRRSLMVLIATAALVAGYYLGNQYQRQQFEPGSITMLPSPKPLPEFELISFGGSPFTRGNLEGKWHLVFFGYTYCPDICPTTLTRYAQVMNRLQEQPEIAEKTRVLFVSVDPERDTPQRLEEYVKFFNPDFLGATGDPAQIAALAKVLALFYQQHEPDANGNYLIDHSAAVAIIDPEARLVGYFSAVLDPIAISYDLGRLVEFYD